MAMRGLRILLCAAASVVVIAAAADTTAAGAGTGATAHAVKCAETLTEKSGGPGSPAPGSCWEEVGPYPFGSEGEPVRGEAKPLLVTSMAFRAWNRGLAVTWLKQANEQEANPFVVWIFNGTSWAPDPTYPGYKSCPGSQIAWAGKLDYWLFGGYDEGNWHICRFDGYRVNQWEPLELPLATKAYLAAKGITPQSGLNGGFTSAACFAWNNCWFFGTYGVVVHWNGEVLSDASPEPSLGWLQGEYTGATSIQGPGGEPLGAAVSAIGAQNAFETSTSFSPLPTQPDGAPAPQLFGSSGEAFSALPFTAPPRTNLVAVGLDAEGQGWVAGNPVNRHLKEHEGGKATEEEPEPQGQGALPDEPAPLIPISAGGPAPACYGPPNGRFTYTPLHFTLGPGDSSFLWSSLAVVPATGEAFAGGRVRGEGAARGEPVITQARCEGGTTVTRFRLPGDSGPADYGASVTAIAANAINDGWASTSGSEGGDQPPRLYHFGNGQPPEAPEGNDEETRPEPVIEPPRYEEEPPPPQPPLPVATIVLPPTSTVLPPAVYDVKVKLHELKRRGQLYLSLYLTFKLRRPVTIGAQALRHGRVVSSARARHFAGRTGTLILRLSRQHWPTNVRFVA